MKFTLVLSTSFMLLICSSTTTNATLLPLEDTNNHQVRSSSSSSSSSSSFETVWIPNCSKNKHKWRPQCKCRYPINWENDICQGTNWWNKTQIVTNVNTIVGGGGGESVTPLTTYPWFVRLMNRNESSYLGCGMFSRRDFFSIFFTLIEIKSFHLFFFDCSGGMLVAPDYVLTAAHCVSPGKDASSLSVLIGAVCLDDDDDEEEAAHNKNEDNNCNQPSQLVNVESITNYPWYFQNRMNNDFALLKLVSRLDNVTPVEM